MKSSEIRLGDCVQYQSSLGMKPTKVTSMNEIGIDLFVHDYHPHDIRADLEYKDVKGIPLTPEILEKAEKHDLFTLGIDIEGDQYVAPNGYSWHTMGFNGRCYYLHQLQNLYHALTGQELNIEL